MQSPSFLAYQRQLAAGHGSNCQNLFCMARIPCDNQTRALLDPVAPQHVFPVFADVVAALARSDGLTAFQRLGAHVLIALDGTEYHRSAKVSNPPMKKLPTSVPANGCRFHRR